MNDACATRCTSSLTLFSPPYVCVLVCVCVCLQDVHAIVKLGQREARTGVKKDGGKNPGEAKDAWLVQCLVALLRSASKFTSPSHLSLSLSLSLPLSIALSLSLSSPLHLPFTAPSLLFSVASLSHHAPLPSSTHQPTSTPPTTITTTHTVFSGPDFIASLPAVASEFEQAWLYINLYNGKTKVCVCVCGVRCSHTCTQLPVTANANATATSTTTHNTTQSHSHSSQLQPDWLVVHTPLLPPLNLPFTTIPLPLICHPLSLSCVHCVAAC